MEVAQSPTLAFLFYVIRGQVEIICYFAKAIEAGQPSSILRMDGCFRPMAHQEREFESLEGFDLSAHQKEHCLKVAQEIGRRFRFARIDLLIGDDGRIYLNEVTFAPAAGLPLDNRDLDRHLRRLWPGAGFFEPSPLSDPAARPITPR